MKVIIPILLLCVISLNTKAQTTQPAQTAPETVLEANRYFKQLIAEEKFTQAIEFGLDAFGDAYESLNKNDTALVPLGLALGTELHKRRAYQEAFAIVQESLNRLERQHGVDSIHLVPALSTLAAMQTSEPRLTTYNRALQLQKKHRP